MTGSFSSIQVVAEAALLPVRDDAYGWVFLGLVGLFAIVLSRVLRRVDPL